MLVLLAPCIIGSPQIGTSCHDGLVCTHCRALVCWRLRCSRGLAATFALLCCNRSWCCCGAWQRHCWECMLERPG